MKLLPWEYGVRNLARSPVRMGLSVLGSALVVLIVLAAAAFVRGMERSLHRSGGERNVILLGAGSEESVERSEIRANVGSLAAASIPGLMTRLGTPYVSPEVHVMLQLGLEREDPDGLRAMLRGVTPAAFLVHGQVRVTEGRAPQPGHDEMMVGRLAAAQLGIAPERLAVGRMLWLENRPWTISGHFEAPGSVLEGEIWCPLADLQIASKRDNLSAVVLTLDRAEFADVDLFCKQRLDLELVALRESSYYAKLNEFYGPIRGMVWVTALLIALGGIFGGLSTMYAAFNSRVRELGSLQTLGFTRGALVLSLVQESMLASVIGALLSAAVGFVFLDGVAVRFSMGAFGLNLDAGALLLALTVGAVLGIVGALPPAWRCLRMPIPDALKAL